MLFNSDEIILLPFELQFPHKSFFSVCSTVPVHDWIELSSVLECPRVHQQDLYGHALCPGE